MKNEEKLKEIIKEGKGNYVLKYGGGFAIFFFLWLWFYFKILVKEEFYFTVNIVICGIMGLIYGLWTWKKINDKVKDKSKVEKKTKKQKLEEDMESASPEGWKKP